MSRPTIAIIGASSDRHKFGNKALRAYASWGYDVFPVHPRESIIEGHVAYRSILDIPVDQLDRVSLYLPPERALDVLEEIARKPVREVWLNPGVDSEEVIDKARALSLPIIAACSIVDIGVSPYDL